MRTPFSWELQTFFLSKKGSQRSKYGGRSKNTLGLSRKTTKKGNGFSLCGSLRVLGKEAQNTPKKTRKSHEEKKKQRIQKCKDRRIRNWEGWGPLQDRKTQQDSAKRRQKYKKHDFRHYFLGIFALFACGGVFLFCRGPSFSQVFLSLLFRISLLFSFQEIPSFPKDLGVWQE